MRIEGFEQDLGWLVDDRERVERHLTDYFVPLESFRDDGSYGFTGRFFEWHIARSDPSRFTESDLLALECLSVTVPAGVAVDLLEDRDHRFGTLLAACRGVLAGSADLRTLDVAQLDEGPLVELYEELKRLWGVGYVRASKLLAAKFPAHIPIRDSRVEEYLGSGDAWWRPMRNLISFEGVAETLGAVVLPGPRVELLRRLDVVLWMERGE